MCETIRYPSDAWRLLGGYLSDSRRQKLERVAHLRTRHLRLVVQDIHHPHNVSACLRSAEAFGIQDVDVVCLKEKFCPSSVARGVSKWLSINKYSTIEACAQNLRALGYRIAAGMPCEEGAVLLSKVKLEEPLAILFGNEHEGVHSEWKKHCDFFFTIPMVGFVESLNISVSNAVTLYELTRRAKEEIPEDRYYLKADDREALLSGWVCEHLEGWDLIYRSVSKKEKMF